MRACRSAQVFYQDTLAGYLAETPQGYLFQYAAAFLNRHTPISLSLPLQKDPFISPELFPFFRGLLPEGWYLDLVSTTQKVDEKDAFGLLLTTATQDSIGAVTIRPLSYLENS
jgi:serine/threonine-protein kinase HipA